MKGYSKSLIITSILLATYGSFRLGQDTCSHLFQHNDLEPPSSTPDSEYGNPPEVPVKETEPESEAEPPTPTPESPMSSLHYVSSIDEFSDADFEAIKTNTASVLRIVLAEENVWDILSGNPRFSLGYFHSLKSNSSGDFKNRLILYFEVPYQDYGTGSAIVEIAYENIEAINGQIQIEYSDRSSTVYCTPYYYHSYMDYDEIYKCEVLLKMDSYSISEVPYDFGVIDVQNMDPLQSYAD
jgi:hypothetical protein